MERNVVTYFISHMLWIQQICDSIKRHHHLVLMTRSGSSTAKKPQMHGSKEEVSMIQQDGKQAAATTNNVARLTIPYFERGYSDTAQRCVSARKM